MATVTQSRHTFLQGLHPWVELGGQEPGASLPSWAHLPVPVWAFGKQGAASLSPQDEVGQTPTRWEEHRGFPPCPLLPTPVLTLTPAQVCTLTCLCTCSHLHTHTCFRSTGSGPGCSTHHLDEILTASCSAETIIVPATDLEPEGRLLMLSKGQRWGLNPGGLARHQEASPLRRTRIREAEAAELHGVGQRRLCTSALHVTPHAEHQVSQH